MRNKFYSFYTVRRHSLSKELCQPRTSVCILREACARLKRFAKVNNTWVLRGRGVNMRLECPEISAEYYCIARTK